MLNDKIFFFFYNFVHQFIFLDKMIVFFADLFPYIVIVLAGIFLLFHHQVLSSKNPFKIFSQKWKEIILVFFSGIFAWGIANLFKIIIQALRPTFIFPQISSLIEKTDFSFPSGHATAFMAIAFAIFFYHKKAGYLFMFFALIIGIARIMAGVHFPIDILGGIILGALIAYLIKYLYDKVSK